MASVGYRLRRLFPCLAIVALTACGGGGGSGTTPSATAGGAGNAGGNSGSVGTSGTPVAGSTPQAGATSPGGTAPGVGATAAPSTGPSTTGSVVARHAFVGAFFRPEDAPPFGVFSAQSPQIAPQPYPLTSLPLLGQGGYCNAVAANGVSITSGHLVDPTKLADVVSLGVGWTRSAPSAFFDDLTHVYGPGSFTFGDFDSAQCALAANGITPVVGLEAGPVQYNAVAGTLSPTSVPIYQTPADFADWCSAVATHERSAFPNVTRYSLPGNEVNSNTQLFSGGAAQIAAYSRACYAAIKAVEPSAFVYGFELNMDGGLNTPGFVQSMTALGCGPGTCYDGIAMHLSLRYPIPPASTPCYPQAGGDYSMQCITAIQTAAGAPVHVLISETVYPVPAAVPNEATKALAVVAAYTAFAADPYVDGVSYADVDECALYTTGYFVGGCLISAGGQQLPAYGALQQLAHAYFL